MARFNTIASVPTVENLAGGNVFPISPRREFVFLVLTSLMQDTFYEKADVRMARLRELIPLVGRRFAAQTAMYARHELGLRSVSHVIAALLPSVTENSLSYGGSDFFRQVVRRPDDMTEIMAAFEMFNKSSAGDKLKLPWALRRGFAAAFNKFDEYQLAKYRGEGKAWTLLDVMRLVHAKPTEANADALAKLAAGELRSTSTWEARLSAGEDKALVWRELVEGGQLGMMALLRNLRNMAEQCEESTWLAALEQLSNAERVRASLIMPFRFLTASKVIEFSRMAAARKAGALEALSAALEHSLANVPELGGRTLVAVDISGSMSQPLAAMSRATAVDVASLFGAVMAKNMRAELMAFASNAGFVRFSSADSLPTIAECIKTGSGAGIKGWGTCAPAILEKLLRGKHAFDRVVIISDMQTWQHSDFGNGDFQPLWHRYRRRIAPTARLFTIDICGYGHSLVPEHNVAAVAGWSDRIFTFMSMLDKEPKSIERTIEAAFPLADGN